MGLLDKAKGLADQAMTKADEALSGTGDGARPSRRMPTSATSGSSPTSTAWVAPRPTLTSSANAV